jgi:hypothetical protein
MQRNYTGADDEGPGKIRNGKNGEEIMDLSDNEKSLLNRIAGQKKIFLAFSIINVVIAVYLSIYYGLFSENAKTIHFVLIMLILLGGRSHLRQYRSAVLLHKLKIWLERKDDHHETDIT